MNTPTSPRPPRASKPVPVHADLTMRHGPVSGVYSAATGTAALGMAADLLGTSAWWAAGAASFGAVASLAWGARTRTAQDGTSLRAPVAQRAYWAACWAASGSWMGWASRADQAPHGDGIPLNGYVALGVGAVGLGVLGRVFPARALARLHHHQAAHHQAGLDASGDEWVARVARVSNGAIRGRTRAIQRWGNGNGYTVEFHIAQGSGGWTRVRSLRHDIADDLALGEGCGVDVRMGRNRRVALIDVTDVNVLETLLPYPPELLTRPETANNPVRCGVFADASDAEMDLASQCAVITGAPESGKSNAGNVLLTGKIRHVDEVIWPIDLGGGRLIRPYFKAWLQGRADRPPFDWAARTGELATTLTRAALAIVRERNAQYGHLMDAVDDDKLPIARGPHEGGVPLLTLVIDECKTLIGETSKWTEARTNIQAIVDEGRGSRVRVIALGLRATQDYIPSSMLALCGVRAGMPANSKAELAYTFDWGDQLDPAEIPYPGCGFLQPRKGIRPRAMKWYRQVPSGIDIVATAAPSWQCPLDDVSTRVAEQVAGRAYVERLDRMRVDFALTGAMAGAGAPTASTGGAAPGPDAEPEQPGDGWQHPIERLSPKEAQSQLADLQAKFDREVAAARADQGDQPPLDHVNGPNAPSSDELEAMLAAKLPGPVRMVQLVLQTGPRGLRVDTSKDDPQDVGIVQLLRAEGYEKGDSTIRNWVTDAVKAGVLIKVGDRRVHVSAHRL